MTNAATRRSPRADRFAAVQVGDSVQDWMLPVKGDNPTCGAEAPGGEGECNRKPGHPAGSNHVVCGLYRVLAVWSSPRTVTVTVPVTVTVDVDKWADEYGTDATVAAVRADVRAYVADGVAQHLQSLGLTARSTDTDGR